MRDKRIRFILRMPTWKNRIFFLSRIAENAHSDYEGMRWYAAQRIVHCKFTLTTSKIAYIHVAPHNPCICSHTIAFRRTHVGTRDHFSTMMWSRESASEHKQACVNVCASVILCITKYSCHGFSDSKALKTGFLAR